MIVRDATSTHQPTNALWINEVGICFLPTSSSPRPKLPLALKLIATNACPSSARAQFRFKFRRIPCALGRTRRDAQGNAPDTTTYQYDPNGNLTSSQRERAGTTTTRSYRTESGHNKLLGFSQTSTSASGTASTSVTHQYDAAGKLQSDGLHQYHYDSQGRLQSSQTGQGPDAPTTRYAHNALGQRVFKTEPLFAAASGKDGALDDEEEDPSLLQTLVDFFTRLWNPAKSEAEHLGWAYLYDEEGSLLGEYGMGGAQSAGQSQYIYLPTAQGPIPMAAEIDNRLYAIHTDHLGTPRRLTQADGQAAWQWAYTPYGDEAPTLGAKRFTNETTNPTTGSTGIPPVRFNLRYPGQYFDEESGLHYNYFRSYDPRTGRYIQGDPIGLEGGWNRFAYVGGNPLNSVDPLGLDYCQTILNLGIAAVQQCSTSPPIPPRPRDMTPKEERYYDRHCAGESDPCAALKAAVNQAIAQARIKMNSMLNDDPINGLFKNAYSTPNPTVTGSNTTWVGHIDDLDGRRASIWSMITLGRRLGCDMSAETAAATTLLTPGAPR